MGSFDLWVEHVVLPVLLAAVVFSRLCVRFFSIFCFLVFFSLVSIFVWLHQNCVYEYFFLNKKYVPT